MEISITEREGNEVVLQVLSQDHRTNYSDVEAASKEFMAAQFPDQDFTYDGAGRVGVGITADGKGMGHQAKFFVGFQLNEG